ncbi:MAG: hypothetical protein FWG88_06830 [Oscillospiraceae bacterium]|nr:hypothetical protein [Oscillospiraceae bacterium]
MKRKYRILMHMSIFIFTTAILTQTAKGATLTNSEQAQDPQTTETQIDMSSTVSTDTELFFIPAFNGDMLILKQDETGFSIKNQIIAFGYAKYEQFNQPPILQNTTLPFHLPDGKIPISIGIGNAFLPTTGFDIHVPQGFLAGFDGYKLYNIDGYIFVDLHSGKDADDIDTSESDTTADTDNFLVELLEWSEVKNMIEMGETMEVIDVRTTRSYNIICFSVYDHADVEPATQEDTDILYETRNGIRSWDARPVWVSIGDRVIAASLHGMPHSSSWISDNGMNGHLCLHFKGSTTSSPSVQYKTDLQNAVTEAWDTYLLNQRTAEIVQFLDL